METGSTSGVRNCAMLTIICGGVVHPGKAYKLDSQPSVPTGLQSLRFVLLHFKLYSLLKSYFQVSLHPTSTTVWLAFRSLTNHRYRWIADEGGREWMSQHVINFGVSLSFLSFSLFSFPYVRWQLVCKQIRITVRVYLGVVAGATPL